MRQHKGQRAGSGFDTNRLLIVALLLTSLSACASRKPGLTKVYYNVPGTTVEQISEHITTLGPLNGHAIGTTETRFAPKAKIRLENGTCRTEDVEVKLDITVTLPQWSELALADGNTRSAFEDLSKHVETHEQRHVEISQQYAQKIEKTLAEFPPMKISKQHEQEIEQQETVVSPQEMCSEMRRKIRTVLMELYKEHSQAHRDFDASERNAIEKRLRPLGLAG